MKMHKGLRSFIRLSLAVMVILALFAIDQASSATDAVNDTISSKDVIMILFGLLQTVFMGIGVWLIGNDRELFTRLRDVETKQAVQDNTCKERTGECSPEHTHKRASDIDPQIALKEAVDAIRQMMHTNKKGEE